MKKLITKKRVIGFALYIFLAIIVFSFFDIYFLGYRTDLSKFTSKVIPYPALFVNSDMVSVGQYDRFLKGYESYLKELGVHQKIDQQLLSRTMIQNIALEQVVTKLDIKFSKQEFNDYVDDFYKNNNISGMNRENYTNYFLKPIYYKEKIISRITDDDFNLENKKKIELIYNDLIKNSVDFNIYSDLYKDQELGINGNMIGWLPYGNLPESLKSRVEKMEIGEFTSIMKSISGYHIYKLNGKIKNEDGSYYYQFDQIFLPIENFSNYLNKFLENSKILHFLN
jgi:parvulin-like peptidyl-prolyl isomerase